MSEQDESETGDSGGSDWGETVDNSPSISIREFLRQLWSKPTFRRWLFWMVVSTVSFATLLVVVFYA